MIWLYYLGFCLALIAAGPALLVFKPKARIGLLQKLGFVPTSIRPKSGRPRIWFHTVSVGEFNATLPLLGLFREQHPDWEVFVSTTTGTGNALAKAKVGDWATVFYFPYDFPWATNQWLDAVQPDVVAIAETEIWPGFIHECARRNIATTIVNGRISPRSFKRYQRIKPFIARCLSTFAAIAAQSEQESARYRGLGAKADAVVACGNMKFDGLRAIPEAEQRTLKERMNIADSDAVLVAGSTHEGEESALLQSITDLKDRNPAAKIRLIIAPRHPERFSRVFQIVESYGYRVRCFSRGEAFEQENDVYVLDTIGQLMTYYSLATVAFVGGTIAKIGGHNIVEPAIYETPVVCGPHTEKTRDVAVALLERGALKQIRETSELTTVLAHLLQSPVERQRIGSAGKLFLDQSQGAVTRTMSVLNDLVDRVFGSTHTGSTHTDSTHTGSSRRGEACLAHSTSEVTP